MNGLRKMFHLLWERGSAAIQKAIPIVTMTTAVPLPFLTRVENMNERHPRKNTGNIISDSLNFIFHLGQQYAKPGQFYVSESVLQLGREEIKGFFSDSGIFEGRTIYQMVLPNHGQNEV